MAEVILITYCEKFVQIFKELCFCGRVKYKILMLCRDGMFHCVEQGGVVGWKYTAAFFNPFETRVEAYLLDGAMIPHA